MRNVSIIDFGACLTFLMFYSYQFMIVTCSQIKKIKYMPLTKIDTSSRNKVDKKSLSLFFNFAIEEKLSLKNALFFTIKFFLFLFLVRV